MATITIAQYGRPICSTENASTILSRINGAIENDKIFIDIIIKVTIEDSSPPFETHCREETHYFNINSIISIS